MTEIHEMIAALGGFARKRELVLRGARDRHLTAAVRDGTVVRARNGWYSTAPTSSPAFRAIRVGGRLTGASALHAAGAWIPKPRDLHVSVPRNASRARSQWHYRQPLVDSPGDRVVLHWDERAICRRGTRTSVAIADAVLAYVMSATLEWAVAALDWLAHGGGLDRFDFEQLFLRLPCRLRDIRSWVDPACESVTESIARTRLRMRGHRVISQVPVGELERIDLVVDGNVALELDGKEFHEGRFERDRRKDLRITLEGRHALRVTYSMLTRHWEAVYEAIVVALRARGQPQNLQPRSRSTRAGPMTPMTRIGRRGRLPMPVAVQ